MEWEEKKSILQSALAILKLIFGASFSEEEIEIFIEERLRPNTQKVGESLGFAVNETDSGILDGEERGDELFLKIEIPKGVASAVLEKAIQWAKDSHLRMPRGRVGYMVTLKGKGPRDRKLVFRTDSAPVGRS